jgi:AcrR family transcriptional regulator
MAQADLTRQRLVRAALELFTAQGYDVTTTAQIAKKAGVAEGTIYRHFVSKPHLLNELYRGAARWSIKFVEDAAAGAGAPRDKLLHLAQGLIEGAGREPAVVRLFFVERLGDRLDAQSQESGREFRGGLERVIAQGKAEGAVRPGAVEVLATIWLAVVSQALHRIATKEWGPDHPGVRLSVEGAWDAIAVAR